MAWTDRSAVTDIQPRIWLLTNGSLAKPGRLLVTRRPELVQGGWFDTGLTGLDTGLDAVSWTDPGPVNRQRVFYVKSGAVQMRTVDGDNLPGTSVALPNASGYTISATDVAAVTFLDGSTQRLAVAAGATKAGQSGYLCVWESLTSGWATNCSTDRPLVSANQDITGVVLPSSTTAAFYYVNSFYGTLSRARRTGSGGNGWILHEPLSVPMQMFPSVLAMPSQASLPAPAKITLAFIGTDNLVHWSRITPSATNPTWAAFPALPGGVTPITTTTAMGGTSYHGTNNGTPYDREKIFVIGSNFALYQMRTTGGLGGWNSAGWEGPFFSPSGYMATVGTVTTATGDPNRQPRVFGAVGYPFYTLQEFSPAAKFNDYIKIQDYPLGVGDSGVPIKETSIAGDNSVAIMTGTDRNAPGFPWKVRLRSSTDGGNSYGASDSIIQPFGGSIFWFLTDSTASVTSGGILHHTVNDTYFPTACHFPEASWMTKTKVSYRRGTSAQAIAALTTPDQVNSFIVDEADNTGLDHPWMVTTADGTVHIVYQGGNTSHCASTGVCYWKRPPNGTPVWTPVIPLVGKPRAMVGANNEVYAHVGDTADGWSKVCTLKNAFTTGVQESDCTMLGAAGGNPPTTIDPKPATMSPTPFISVGPELTNWPVPGDNQCPERNQKKYKCFNHYPLRSVAADPTVPYKVYVAYTVGSANSSDIWFAHSTGGASWGVFSPNPARFIAGGGAYFDPQVTVDSDGTIVVTYLEFSTAPSVTTGDANFRMVYSTDGGDTFQAVLPAAYWNSSMLPYHCSRGTFFVGEYMDGKAFGNRAYVNYPAGGSQTTPWIYQTAWVSKWNMTN